MPESRKTMTQNNDLMAFISVWIPNQFYMIHNITWNNHQGLLDTALKVSNMLEQGSKLVKF